MTDIWNGTTYNDSTILGGFASYYDSSAVQNFTADVDTNTTSFGSSFSWPQEPEEEEEAAAAATSPVFYYYLKAPSALLSVVCSSFVIYHVVQSSRRQGQRQQQQQRLPRRQQQQQGRNHGTFYRLLIGLCSFDILSSTALFLEPFIKQNDIPGHWTCTAGGLFTVTGITGSSFYNCGLSTFYFVVVVRDWSNATILSHLERPLHLLVSTLVIYWLVGIPLEVYNPTNVAGGCWAIAYPENCTKVATATTPACIRGDPWGRIYDLTTTIGFILTVLILLSTNLAIFCKVRSQENRTERYQRFDTVAPGRTTATAPLPESAAAAGNTIGSSFQRNGTDIDPTDTRTVPDNGNNDNTNNSMGNGRQFRRQRTLSSFSENSRTTKTKSKARQVAIQSYLYCGGYLAIYIVTFLHASISGGVQHYDAWWYPIVRTLQEITLPLQGFLNALVYIRPRYLQWRKAVPGSKWQALKATLSAKPVPHHHRRRSLSVQQSFQQGDVTGVSNVFDQSSSRMEEDSEKPNQSFDFENVEHSSSVDGSDSIEQPKLAPFPPLMPQKVSITPTSERLESSCTNSSTRSSIPDDKILPAPDSAIVSRRTSRVRFADAAHNNSMERPDHSSDLEGGGNAGGSSDEEDNYEAHKTYNE